MTATRTAWHIPRYGRPETLIEQPAVWKFC